MPGRGSYGPGGKWIYDRANRIMEKNPDMPKGQAYAVATQQAHKVGKSPKKFRTAEGVATAKAKMRGPVKEYRKTAAFDEARVRRHVENRQAFRRKARKIQRQEALGELKGGGKTGLIGAGLGAIPGAIFAGKGGRGAAAGLGAVAGGSIGFLAGSYKARKKERAKRPERIVQAIKDIHAERRKTASAAFFNELEKISQTMQHFEDAVRRGGGRMTPEAYQAGHDAWRKQQAVKRKLAPRLAAHKASQGRLAKKPAQGLFSRIARAFA